jgi:predicted enzyme related to lactoylglutathione lyase
MTDQDQGLALAESRNQDEQKANPQGDFMWYELLTDDVDAAVNFYGPILGWKVTKAEGTEHDYHIIHADDGDIGGMMVLPADAKAHGMRPTWLGYVTVDNVDAAAAKIVADGGKEHMPPTDVPGIIRFALVADPQGASFYVARGYMEGTSTAFAADKVGHCQWNELITSDQAAAWTFYGNQFGWAKGDVMPMGDMGDYEFLTQKGQTIGAFMRKDPDKPPRWRFYFGVADIDVAADTVNKGGGTIAHGPAEVPGGIFIIIGTDPQGAEFGLVGPRKS